MPTSKLELAKRTWTAAELRQLAPQDRDAILAAAAELAEDDYKTDAELTAFDAFGEGELHGESADAGNPSR